MMLTQCIARAGQLDKLEHLPGYQGWKLFIEASRDQLVTELQTSKEPIVAQGIHGISESIESLQKTGAALAEALKIWPKICEAAATLST